MGSHGNLLNLMTFVENLIFVVINDLRVCPGGFSCLRSADIIIIVFREIISSECFSFLRWFLH